MEIKIYTKLIMEQKPFFRLPHSWDIFVPEVIYFRPPKFQLFIVLFSPQYCNTTTLYYRNTQWLSSSNIH